MSESMEPSSVMRVGATYREKRTGQLFVLKRASAGAVYLEKQMAGGATLTMQRQSVQIRVSPQGLQQRYEAVTN